jgi:hypothetical protein
MANVNVFDAQNLRIKIQEGTRCARGATPMIIYRVNYLVNCNVHSSDTDTAMIIRFDDLMLVSLIHCLIFMIIMHTASII